MLSVRVCEKPHRKTTRHVYGQQGRVFIFPCMQGVNHSAANEQMAIPKEACRLLKSKIRGIPGMRGQSGDRLMGLHSKFTGCYRTGWWLRDQGLSSSKIGEALFSEQKTLGRLLIGCVRLEAFQELLVQFQEIETEAWSLARLLGACHGIGLASWLSQ